jgi:serine/threonine protein kinase
MALAELRPEDPTVLGRFRLQGRLGAGGMGLVFLGFDPSGRPAAVKTLPVLHDATARARIAREADLLAAVDHARVAHLVDADVDGAVPWIALDYIVGPSLAEAQTPLSDPALRQLAVGLRDALAALHAVGIEHRDVKPANVVLTHEGPVLVDLGIARSEDMTSMTTTGTVIGSPAWMAPEQFLGEPTTSATDVWGWGATIVFAAVGQHPFGNGDATSLRGGFSTLIPNSAGSPTGCFPTSPPPCRNAPRTARQPTGSCCTRWSPQDQRRRIRLSTRRHPMIPLN